MQQPLPSTFNRQQVAVMTQQPKASGLSNRVAAHGKAKKNHAVAAHSKVTRPLNSWIAFRCFYAVLFMHIQQKDISGLLTFLWQTDPFKGKWSILAKAYSIIRDQHGKENAPLDKFLLINTTFIGIADPKHYLDILGWEIAVDVDGQVVIRREIEVDVNTLDRRLLITNKSVDDVIRNSYHNGYILEGTSAAALGGNGASLTMATSAQPPSNVAGTMANGNADSTSGITQATSISVDDMTTTTIAADPEFDPDNLSPNTLQWINFSVPDPAIDPPISSLLNTAYKLDGPNALISEFDPELPSKLRFDPFMGNKFNTFNMSDWIDDKAY